ncbi:hypothetical protein CKO15_04590 [Halorhodospira abdelmalekii]|nr:hypothetical protein [Halorhodospira abdelmalekii]
MSMKRKTKTDSDVLYQSLLTCHPEGVCTLDLEGRFTYLNPAACDLLGHESAESLLGHAVSEVICTRKQCRACPMEFQDHSLVAALIAGKIPRGYEEVCVHRSDGSTFPAAINIAALRTGEGEPAIGLVLSLRDITEQRKQETALRHREQRFALAIEAANAAVWEFDLVTGEVHFGPRGIEIYGCPPGSAVPFHDYESWRTRIHPDDLLRIEAEAHAAREQGVPWIVDYRVIRPNGEIRHVRSACQQLCDDDGGVPLRIVGFEEDRTAEVTTLERLQQLVAILDNTSDFVVMHGPDGRLVFMNAAGRRVVGLPDEPFLGAPATTTPYGVAPGAVGEGGPPAFTVEESIRHYHPEWAADLLLNEALPTAMRDGIWQGETAIIDAQGREIPTSQVIIPHRSTPSGELTEISTILRDISQTKQAQEELALSERRFRQIAESIHEVFGLSDKEKLLYVNPAYETIWGRSTESLYADPCSFSEAIHPEDRDQIIADLREARETRSDFDALFRIIRSDGEVRWVHMQSVPVRNNDAGEDEAAAKALLRASTARDMTEHEERLRGRQK